VTGLAIAWSLHFFYSRPPRIQVSHLLFRALNQVRIFIGHIRGITHKPGHLNRMRDSRPGFVPVLMMDKPLDVMGIFHAVAGKSCGRAVGTLAAESAL
jgi:hypothetical protein